MINEIQTEILGSSYGNRSYTKQVHSQILEQDMSYEIACRALDVIASSISNMDPLTNSCRRMAAMIVAKLQLPMPNDNSLLKLGIAGHDWFAQCNLITVSKYPTIEEGSIKEHWYVVSNSHELTNYSKTVEITNTAISAADGPRIWTKPSYYIGDFKIPIVKKADRYELLDNYTYEAMPKFYDALNRLNKQPFRVNNDVYNLAMSEFPFVPRTISTDEIKLARRSLNDINRKAKFKEELKFEERYKWLQDNEEVEQICKRLAEKFAKEVYQDYYDEKSEPHKNVISDLSKRLEFDKIIHYATEWKNQELHYFYQADTRGRVYAAQNYLNPLGSDLAKAMLVFGEAYQVSLFDLCVHIANCFGKDKLSFEDRVDWVNTWGSEIYSIGSDPLDNLPLIQRLSLDKENKTKWQGIAACIEYRKVMDYMSIHGTEEGYLSNLIIGLDATASGTQILTMLGRDHQVAPYVNVSRSTTGRVGDFYTYLSNFLKPKLEKYRGESDTLDILLDSYEDYARKLSKRNSMTFSYSGTRWGFGQQQWEDRHDYNLGEEDKTGSNLSRKDCRIIGNEMYDVCVENIRGGAEVMKWLRDGMNYLSNGSVVSWTLPDGFIAFQVCDQSKSQSVEGMIGDTKVTLKYYVFADKPKISEHKNGISPNWVHSLDAYLLRMIVLGMPDNAPISTVHDQFCTNSYHIKELQDVARSAYKTIANREVAEKTCLEAFGIHRELPIAGQWTTDELDHTEFFIC